MTAYDGSMQLQDTATAYGLRALATVVFDIDSGQRLDALHPPTCGFSEAAKLSLTHLSLPHCSNQDEGDTQFIMRFPNSPIDPELLFGFVLFRQQKDKSRARGYFQKALVLISNKPYVDLYERLLRVVGPLFFKAGPQILAAAYNDINLWPTLVHETPIALPLAGTYISCIIPKLLNYEKMDTTNESDRASPVESYCIVEGNDTATDVTSVNSLDEDDNGKYGSAEKTVLVSEGNFVVSRRLQPPSLSFGDLLLSKRTHQLTPFENIGLYSSFFGLAESLWLLWQLAITGESLLVLSPHARTCSRAVLAFTSLIAPLKFQGDCRPYYTVYEADFETLANRHNSGVSSSKDVTIIGTTDPFFLKSFSQWPNALIFPSLEIPSANATKGRVASHAEAVAKDIICLRIQKNVKLDDFAINHRPMLLRRCPRYMVPDVTVLRQLICPSKIHMTCPTGYEEEPYVTINNANLRKHFRKLTKDFLQPFEKYFGIWKECERRSNLYMSAEDYMKPFTLPGLLSSIKPVNLPSQIKPRKWKALYAAFVKGPHFEPWFKYRRQRCIDEFAYTLRTLRDTVDTKLLLSSPFGADLPQEQYLKLEKEMENALAHEKARIDVDKQQVRTIIKHLKSVKEKLRSI